MGGNTLDMTKGSAWKLIVQFAVPVFLSQVFQQLYNTADALIVGRFLGDEALAAVSASGPLIFLLISFFTGLSMGAGVTISRYFGAGDYDRVSKAIHTDVMLGLISGVILTVVGGGPAGRDRILPVLLHRRSGRRHVQYVQEHHERPR